MILVEEPMAEFGMLLYLHEAKMPSYYKWACEDVSGKKTCYRYGWALLQQHLREEKLCKSNQTHTRNDLVRYKYPLI